jgi:hypothetical protein
MLFKTYRSLATEMGHLNAQLYGANRLFEKWRIPANIYRYVLVSQPVSRERLLPRSRRSSIEIRNVEPGDSELLTLPPPAKVIAERYSQGAVCLGAFRERRLIGCIWLCLGSYNEDEVRCRFVPEPSEMSAWDFDVFIVPEYRAGLLFARIWDAANEYLRARGVKWSMSRITAFNAASLAAHSKLGARRLGSATYFRIYRWQLMFSSIAPFCHLSTNDLSVPSVRLRAPANDSA